MKTILYTLFIAISCMSSCNKKVSTSLFTTPCDLDDRKNISLIENENGHIEEKNSDFIIRLKNNSSLFPCNLPDEFKVNGIPVVFSGYKKRALPTEKWVGAPFKLSRIKK